MSSQLAEISPVVKQLNVVVDGQSITKELDKAYRKLGEQVSIKGFRQGKIPRQVLERYYRKDVEQDVLGKLIGEAFRDAVVEHKMEPVANPDINVGEFVPGQDLSFSARVEVRPTISLKDYKGLPATEPAWSVSDEDVERAVEEKRLLSSTVVPVEGRDTVQEHDLCTCNFSSAVDGVEYVGGQGSAYVIEPGAGIFVKGVEDALVGKKLGEAFEVDAQLPESFRNREVAGKVAHFKVTVTDLKTRQMPTLDDEFAKDVGDFEGLADLRKKLREDLEKQAKSHAEEKAKEELIKLLIDRNPFELPPSLVERQIDASLYSMVGRLNADQMSRLGLDRQKLREDLREGAVRSVRTVLLLEAVADEEKIELPPDELELYFHRTAMATGQAIHRVREAFRNEDRLTELKARMRRERALDLVYKAATINRG
jgi:trigger factor